MLCVVPNELRDAINKKVDAFILQYPDQKDNRENIYKDMLSVFNSQGVIPGIALKEDK